MIRPRRRLFCAVIVLALTATFAPAHAADDTIHTDELVGKWKNREGKTFELGLNGTMLTLKTKVSDWDLQHYNEKNATLSFQRKTTEDDIRKMKLDKSQPAAPDSVVTGAAGVVGEGFRGYAKRGGTFSGARCKLTMKVTWIGFHLKFSDDGTWDKDRSPETKDDYTQIRYGLPDLRTVTVQTRLEAPDIAEQDRVSAGTEIQDYFNDRAAMKLLGEFGWALFKPFFGAINEAAPPESFLENVGRKVLETAVEKGLQGDLTAKNFVKVVTGQVLDKILGAAADREPIASIKAKLDKALGAKQVEALTDKAREVAKGTVGDTLTKEDQVALGEYLKNQCRYEMIRLPAHGKVAGGVAFVDKQLGTAEFWLLVEGKGSRPTMTVQGTMGNLPEDGERPNGFLTVQFTALK